ncbi:MAG TPA: hypothetical protein VGA34_02995 [Alteraurantiacibacter sp.]|jgi:hypothetical protein
MTSGLSCRATVLALAALAVASCEPADGDPGPGGVTVGEARALDEAAEMIEQQRLPDEFFEKEAGAEAAQGEDSAEAPPPAPSGS